MIDARGRCVLFRSNAVNIREFLNIREFRASGTQFAVDPSSSIDWPASWLHGSPTVCSKFLVPIYTNFFLHSTYTDFHIFPLLSAAALLPVVFAIVLA